MQWIHNGINTNNICNSENARWLPSFLVCIRTLHENVKFWTFHQNKLLNQPLKYDYEETTEEYPQFDFGFQQTCVGDSGGGHWMKEGGDGIRQILIGVVTASDPVCGDAAFTETINNKETMNWIK